MFGIYYILGMLALLAVILAVYSYSKADDETRAEFQASFGQFLDRCSEHAPSIVLGAGASLMSVAFGFLMWGFGGVYVVVAIAVFGAVSAAMGYQRSYWVGPGAEAMNRHESFVAFGATVMMIILGIAAYVLSLYFQFNGFCPWPPRA